MEANPGNVLDACDAHCHPTEQPSSLQAIPKLNTSKLTIMGTSCRDWNLVAETAEKYPERVIPSFGWHPWFSWELFNDLDRELASFPSEKVPTASCAHEPLRLHDKKIDHYLSILTPQPDLSNRADVALLDALPSPIPLSWALSTIRAQLEKFPNGAVGEVGLDKVFRVRIESKNLPEPEDKKLGSFSDAPQEMDGDNKKAHQGEELSRESDCSKPEGLHLSRFRVSLSHQKSILQCQLDLASQMNRPASVHGVQAQMGVLESVQNIAKNCKLKSGNSTALLRVCLHSYSGHAQSVRPYLSLSNTKVYFSFSPAVNLSSCPKLASARALSAVSSLSITLEDIPFKLVDVIKAVPEDRILVESDLPSADEGLDTALQVMIRVVCLIKGWDLLQGAARLNQNFEQFVQEETH